MSSHGGSNAASLPESSVLLACDQIVAEYLMFRGLTSTTLALKKETSSGNQSTVTEPTPGSKQSSLTPPQHSAGNPASRAVRSRQLSAYYRNILFSPPSLTSAIYSSLSHTRSFSDFSTLWNILYSRFFSQVNVPLDTISSYESSLIKLYLSSCYEAGDIEACRRFFEEHGGGWGRQNFQIGAWRQWFSLCYMKNAKDDQIFSIFFTPPWRSALKTSLHNLLSSVISNVPLPTLIYLQKWATTAEQAALRRELEQLRSDKSRLEADLASSKESVERLKSSVSRFSQVFKRALSGLGSGTKKSLWKSSVDLARDRVDCLKLAEDVLGGGGLGSIEDFIGKVEELDFGLKEVVEADRDVDLAEKDDDKSRIEQAALLS